MQVQPFLMFQDGRAEEALRFYAELFGGTLGELGHHPDGKLLRGTVTIAGQTIMGFDSPVQHAFAFTPSVSLFVTCDDDAQIERIAAALLEDRAALMPLDNYGFSRRFAWVTDRFGVTWQLNLP